MLLSTSIPALVRCRDFLHKLKTEKLVSREESLTLLSSALLIDKLIDRLLKTTPSLFDSDKDLISDEDF